MDVVPIDPSDALAAVDAAAAPAVNMVQSIPDPSARATGLDWTLGEVAAHLVSAMRLHTEWVRGEGKIDYCIPDLAAENARNIQAIPTRDPAELARLLSDSAAAFLAVARAADPSRLLPELVGPDLSLATVASVLLGELVLHGYDIARTIGRPWPIRRRTAILIIGGATAIMPEFVNSKAAAGLRATYEVRLRGGPAFQAKIDDGTMQVEPATSSRADCKISADPVALLLVSYGRIGPWGPIAKGQMLAWGRRPLLALKFTSLLRNP